MSAQIVNLATYREDRMIERFYELMVGDLDAPALDILEQLDTEAIDMFFRLRKRVQAKIADQTMAEQARRGQPLNPYR